MVLLAFLYRNNLPFAYHVRFLWHVCLAWFCGRRPPHALAASEKTFRVWPDDVDFNWHMNNSSCASHTAMVLHRSLLLPALEPEPESPISSVVPAGPFALLGSSRPPAPPIPLLLGPPTFWQHSPRRRQREDSARPTLIGERRGSVLTMAQAILGAPSDLGKERESVFPALGRDRSRG